MPRLCRSIFALLAFLAVNSLPASVHSYDLTTLTAADAFTPERGHGFDLGTAPDASGQPFYFSVAVPEGNWRVTVTFGDPAVASDNTVKAESRRLMLEHVATAPGEFVTRTFIVNVRNRTLPPPLKNAPGGSAVLTNEREEGSFTWDDKLTLEFNGLAPRVRAIVLEPANVPTIYLLGDSTVTDQRWEDGASWGQMLTRFLAPDIAVANHAESGETLKSFVTGLRLAKVLSHLRAGDWLFIQFGHNDQKQQWPQTYVAASTTYKAWLRTFIAEARLRGATPVLVTSTQRRNFDAQGRIINTHGGYPQAVREVAAEEKVALVDLEALSRSLYEVLGPELSPRLFANGGKDATHHNNLGAYLLAQCVAKSLRDGGVPLTRYLVTDLPLFDPTHPGNPNDFKLPASPLRSTIVPRNWAQRAADDEALNLSDAAIGWGRRFRRVRRSLGRGGGESPAYKIISPCVLAPLRETPRSIFYSMISRQPWFAGTGIAASAA
ncbi:MAG: rhamnogalacturonan acetylesterase [Opitutaceae bacterium]|nr:rhamnogalacturonan acetylesterase [Opitutaceae bacterium]